MSEAVIGALIAMWAALIYSTITHEPWAYLGSLVVTVTLIGIKAIRR